MGKKRGKKKQQQQQPAFKAKTKVNPVFVIAAKNNIGTKGANARLQQGSSLVQIPLNKALQPFQKPHEGKPVPELTDDTSPNIPLPAKVKPGDPTKKNSGKPTQLQNNWLKFQETIKKKEVIQPFHNTFVEAKDSVETGSGDMKPSTSKDGSEITWELNPIEDKDKIVIAGQAPTKPVVVEGKASEIKLFQNKDTSAIKKPGSGTILMDKTFNSSGPHNTRGTSSFEPWPPGLIADKSWKPPPIVLTAPYAYPKGVPKSFLANQLNQSAIQPQEPQPVREDPQPTRTSSQIPTHQYEQPPYVQTSPVFEPAGEANQQYSPSDSYDDGKPDMDGEGSESPNGQGAQKRLSAFQRLGPVSQPKKPKLTINLLCDKDQSVREVVNQTQSMVEEEKFTPVHLRKGMRDSNDEIVLKYLPDWPWKRAVNARKSVTARTSKSVMILEQEQMEEVYEKDTGFLQISVRGYPNTWRKEQVLDVVLDNIRGKSFIPCFIEFKPDECVFLVIKCKPALLAIHKMGFFLRKDDVELAITISQTILTLKQIDFIPRLVLRKILANGYDGERKLCLKEFTLGNEISHFIYFPLSRLTNQSELVQLQSTIAWNYITDLDLSHNKLTTIDGFELPITTPRLKHLDLSFNYLQKITALLRNRELSLRSLKLEGNPLCHDYIDPGHYVKVVKMIFPGLVELDGVPIHLKGDFPKFKQNYCPNREAMEVANRFLDVYFPLLEMTGDERARLEDLYDEKATLTVTYRYSLRHSALYRKFRNLFLRARVIESGDEETISGALAIARLLNKWPDMQHDPYTFTVDVLLHSENHTIIKIGGILKLTSESLAEDEHLLAFTRNIVLATEDGVKYKVKNEMVYWDEPCREMANVAFQRNSISATKRMPLKLEINNPDEGLKTNLVEIFMHITNIEKAASERCLELKEWNLKSALEHFMKLVKLDDLDSLRQDSPKLV